NDALAVKFYGDELLVGRIDVIMFFKVDDMEEGDQSEIGLGTLAYDNALDWHHQCFLLNS
ncbi:hypothetical protein Tco_0737803, partial [Tanacetum coccineum]